MLEFMEEYGLTREDWDSVIELADLRGNGKDELDSIPRDVKTAFTKAYVKRDHDLINGDLSEISSQATVGHR